MIGAKIEKFNSVIEFTLPYNCRNRVLYACLNMTYMGFPYTEKYAGRENEECHVDAIDINNYLHFVFYRPQTRMRILLCVSDVPFVDSYDVFEMVNDYVGTWRLRGGSFSYY